LAFLPLVKKGGLFQFQKGWGELYAPLKLKGEILEIIEIVRSE
jgi:hypothetical protein